MSFWLEQAVQFAVAMLATMCFGLTFNVDKRHFIACGLTGAVGWLVYCIANGLLGLSAPAATLLAALPLTAAARLFAIRHRAPVTVFLLCGIFPLVPGAGIYWTVYYLVTDEIALARSSGTSALKAAFAIVLAIAAVFELPRGLFRCFAPRRRH